MPKPAPAPPVYQPTGSELAAFGLDLAVRVERSLTSRLARREINEAQADQERIKMKYLLAAATRRISDASLFGEPLN